MQSKIYDCITFFDNNFMFNFRYNILKDYPTINGMLHKGEIVSTFDNLNENKIVRCKDATGKIWFLKKEIIKELI